MGYMGLQHGIHRVAAYGTPGSLRCVGGRVRVRVRVRIRVRLWLWLRLDVRVRVRGLGLEG